MPSLVRLLGLALFWLLASATAFAVDPEDTGKALGVDPSASAELQNVTRTLEIGSNVSIGDTVVTGPTGQVQLQFSDDTKLIVGPSSSLLIEAYLLRPDKHTASQVTVDALSGSFRFITGNSAKNAYRIDTPYGDIGVRGTRFDLHVGDTGASLVLFEGKVHMCNLDDKCVEVGTACGVGMMTPDVAALVPRSQQASLQPFFPYIASDEALLPDFQVDNAGNCLKPAATPAPTHTTSSTPPAHKPPPTQPHKPTNSGPVVTFELPDNPCDNYAELSRAQKQILAQEHIYCRPRSAPEPSPGGLADPPFGFGRPPRDGGSSGDGGTVLY